MNKLGFLGVVSLIMIILLIVGAVVSYNFFKNSFSENEESGEDEKLANDENKGSEKLEGEDSGENSGEDLEVE